MKRSELRTLLYVDDEPDIREVVEMSLSLAPQLDVHVCESGERALTLVSEIRPQLILLDVMMPGMDGPATLGHLHSDPATRNIPVVFMTAKAMPAEIERFREIGAVAVIAKPFDPMQLAEQIFAIWEGLLE